MCSIHILVIHMSVSLDICLNLMAREDGNDDDNDDDEETGAVAQ